MSVVPTFGCVVLDCPDPRTLAGFYASLLDWGEPKSDSRGQWVDLVGPGGVAISFQRVEGYRAPKWPGQDMPQQLHLDLRVSDLIGGRERALSLGAKLLDDHRESFHVYADPAGHPFCLCAC